MQNICVMEISVGGRRFTGCIHPALNPKVEARKLLNRLDPTIKCGFRVRTTEYAFVPVDPGSLNFKHLEPVRVKRYGF